MKGTAASGRKVRRFSEPVAADSHPYFICALDGTIVSWSPAAAEFFGVPEQRVLGRQCDEVVSRPSLSPRPPSDMRIQHQTLVDDAGEPVGVLHVMDSVEVVPGLFLG